MIHSLPAAPLTRTIADVVADTRISRAQLYRLAKGGEIRFAKVGRTTLVVWQSVLDYIKSVTVPAAGLSPLAGIRPAT